MSVHKYLASLVAYSVASSPVSNVTPHFAGEWKWFAARKKARTGLPACEVTSSFWKRDYAHLLLWAELHQLSYKEHCRRSRTPPSHIRGSSRGSENRKCTAKTVKGPYMYLPQSRRKPSEIFRKTTAAFRRQKYLQNRRESRLEAHTWKSGMRLPLRLPRRGTQKYPTLNILTTSRATWFRP